MMAVVFVTSIDRGNVVSDGNTNADDDDVCYGVCDCDGDCDIH